MAPTTRAQARSTSPRAPPAALSTRLATIGIPLTLELGHAYTQEQGDAVNAWLRPPLGLAAPSPTPGAATAVQWAAGVVEKCHVLRDTFDLR